MLQRYWFGDVDEQGCRAAGTDPAALALRATTLRTGMESYVPIDWEVARDCGVARTREEYVDLLRSVCTALARKKIAQSYQGRDVELLQMIRMLDELDNVINLLSERSAEWYQVTTPSFSRKYRSLPAKKMLDLVRRGARGGLSDVAGDIERLAGTRSRLMREVSARADEVLPNTRALIVGLTALGWNLFSRRENRITWPMQFIMLWGGLRGALPIALAVSIGAALVPQEEQTRILQLTLGIILFTILVQGTTMKRFMRRFGMVGSDPPAAD